MKTKWQIKKLGEICDILDNLRKPVTARDRKSGDYPYYGATGIQDYVDGYIFDEDLILVGEDGARWNSGDNTAFKISGKTWVNNHAHVIRPDRNILLDQWLIYFLNISDLSDYITGTTVKKLNQEKLRSIPIPLPPIKTQKEIVEKLDEKITKLREVKKLREEALLDTEKILSQTLREIFATGKQKGWGELKIIDIANISPAKSEIKDFPDSTVISFIPMSSVDEYSQKIEEQEKRKLGEVRKGYTYFKRGDIILAKVTPCMENGKIAICDNLKNEIGFGSSEFHVIRADKKLLNPKYLYQILRQKDFREIAVTRMTGTSGLKRVPKEFIENYEIILPSLLEQEEIVARLDRVSENIKTLREFQKSQLEDLKLLEKTYLREAFNGELN
jgi:type I restriction enzyme, S subunit